MRIAAVVAALAILLACKEQQPQPAEFVMRHTPPGRVDVIEAIMASHDIPLSISPTCANVGAKPGDNTIGAYLSGFISELKDEGQSRNWIGTRVTEARDVWRCEFTVRHSAGEDEWGWGVRFNVRRSDGRIIRDSFECTGGG